MTLRVIDDDDDDDNACASERIVGILCDIILLSRKTSLSGFRCVHFIQHDNICTCTNTAIILFMCITITVHIYI